MHSAASMARMPRPTTLVPSAQKLREYISEIKKNNESEFKKSVHAKRMRVMAQDDVQRVQTIFKLFDVGSNGQLEAEDYALIFQSLGIVRGEMAHRFFQSAKKELSFYLSLHCAKEEDRAKSLEEDGVEGVAVSSPTAQSEKFKDGDDDADDDDDNDAANKITASYDNPLIPPLRKEKFCVDDIIPSAVAALALQRNLSRLESAECAFHRFLAPKKSDTIPRVSVEHPSYRPSVSLDCGLPDMGHAGSIPMEHEPGSDSVVVEADSTPTQGRGSYVEELASPTTRPSDAGFMPLDRHGLCAAFEQCGARLTDSEILEILNYADLDRDGEIGEQEFVETVSMVDGIV